MSLRTFDPIDWNYWQATAGFSARSSRGAVIQTRGLVLADVGAPVAQFNCAFVAEPEQDLDAGLDAAEEFFGARQHPYRVVLREDQLPACEAKLRERGFASVDEIPGMTLAKIPDEIPRRRDVDLRRVDDAKTLADFQATAFAGFGLPVRGARHFLTEALLATPEFEAIVGYVDGQPACTSALFESAGVAGVYWVSTLEAYRSQGLGAAATWAAVEAGRRRGHRLASLQASAMGKPVYEKMGFAIDRRYARWEKHVAAAS